MASLPGSLFMRDDKSDSVYFRRVNSSVIMRTAFCSAVPRRSSPRRANLRSGPGQTVETPSVVDPSLDTELDLRTADLGAVHELVKIGPGTLGLSQMQTLRDLFYRKRRLLAQTGCQRQLFGMALLPSDQVVQALWLCYRDSCLDASCCRNIFGVTFSTDISLKFGFFLISALN